MLLIMTRRNGRRSLSLCPRMVPDGMHGGRCVLLVYPLGSDIRLEKDVHTNEIAMTKAFILRVLQAHLGVGGGCLVLAVHFYGALASCWFVCGVIDSLDLSSGIGSRDR